MMFLTSQFHRFAFAAMLVAVSSLCSGSAWAQPETQNQQREIKALMRALDFARGLPTTGKLDVTVLYDVANRNSEAEADQAIAIFKEQLAKGSSLIGSVHKRDVKSLAEGNPKNEIFYLTGNVEPHYADVYRYAADNHILTMSSDERCAQVKCCVISAVAGDSVQIYINQQAMRGIGFDFDAAFKFIAKQL